MNVHTHDNLRTGKFPECMFDTIGDIRRQSYLGLHFHFRCTGLQLQLLKEPYSLFTSGITMLVVIHDVECNQFTV